MLRGEAFERALAAFCSAREPERLRLLATYGAQGLRKMLTGVYETLRSAGRDLPLELGRARRRRRAPRRAAGRRLAARGRSRCHGETARRGQRRARARIEPRAAARPRPAGDRRAHRRVPCGTRPVAAGCPRGARSARQRAPAGAAQPVRGRVRRREAARVGARLRGPPALCARPAAGRRGRPRDRAAAFPVDHGRRVPGHEPAAVRGDRPAARAGPERATSSSSATSSSRSTDSGTPTSPSSASAARQLRRRLPLTRNYRSRPEVLAAVNHLFGDEFGDDYQPLAASGEFSDPVFGHPVELQVTRQAELQGARARAGATARRGAIARRVRELVDGGAASPGEIVLLFAAGTDAERLRVGAPGRRAADLPRDRSRVLRPAAGRRPARLPAPPPEPLRRRGARHRARVAVRRRLERRARADPPARRQASALHRHRAVAARGALE